MNAKSTNINILSKWLIDAYRTKNEKQIKKIVSSKPINSIVEAIEAIDDIDVVKFVLFSSRNIKIGQLFHFLPFERKVQILESATNKLISEIFNDMEVDDIYEFVMDISSELFRKIILIIDPEIRKQLLLISKYEEGEAGSIMNTSFFRCYEEWNINKAIDQISKSIDKNDFDKFIYVLNKKDQLVGKLEIYEIFLEKKRTKKIKEIMDEAVVSIDTDCEIEEIIQIFQKYNRESIPVVNREGMLVGVIDDNDILPAIQEEITEDIYKMYGITTLENPYARTSVLDIFKSRVIWLMVLMIVSTLTSFAIEYLTKWSNSILSDALSTAILIPIIPVISGTSGNAGSQSAASVIRALSIGEISKKDYKRVIWREIQVALLMALSLAIFNFIRLLIYYAITNPMKISPSIDGWGDISIISLAISLCLFISIFLSKTVGAFLPLFAMKINTDPTSMASPMLTTLIDTATTTILFTIGTGIIMLISN